MSLFAIDGILEANNAAMMPSFDWYVSPDGSDSNDGTTLATAFYSPGKARDVAISGNNIYVNTGTYPTYDINGYILDENGNNTGYPPPSYYSSLAKDGVNWYFETGSIIDARGIQFQSIVSAAWYSALHPSYTVTGYGTFYSRNSGVYVYGTTTPSVIIPNVNITANLIQDMGETSALVNVSYGNLILNSNVNTSLYGFIYAGSYSNITINGNYTKTSGPFNSELYSTLESNSLLTINGDCTWICQHSDSYMFWLNNKLNTYLTLNGNISFTSSTGFAYPIIFNRSSSPTSVANHNGGSITYNRYGPIIVQTGSSVTNCTAQIYCYPPLGDAARVSGTVGGVRTYTSL